MSDMKEVFAVWLRNRAASAATAEWSALWHAQAEVMRDSTSAKAELERLALSNSSDVAAAACASLGDILADNGRYEDALAAYGRAVARVPNSVTYAACAYAATLIALRRYDLAVEEYRRLVLLLNTSDIHLAELLSQDLVRLAGEAQMKSIAAELLREITSRVPAGSSGNLLDRLLRGRTD